MLSDLLFSLAFTTSAVENAFSKLKLIKTDRRCSLQTSTLDDLLEINLEGPTLKKNSSAYAVDLWWSECMRRPNQTSKSRSMEPGTSTGLLQSEPDVISLDKWDELFSDI